MRVLIVDAFGPSPRSRKKFQTFERVVTSSLKKSLSSLACGFTLLKRGFHSLDGFDLSIPSKYAMTLREIDKLDLVFIDGDMRLLPWRAPSNKLLMLIKVCIMAQKCVFAAASASLFMAHLCACGCRSEATQVVNGGGAGGPLSALSKCPAYKKVTGFKPVFLDNKTGRTYSRDGDTWKYCCNIGICLSRVSKTKSTRKLQNASFPRQMHFHASKNKVPCQIAKTCFRHKLFEGISAAEFEITLNDRWVIMQQHQSPRPDLRFNVLAHNHSTPLIIECANVCGLRFSVHPTLSQTTTILQNWVDMKIKEMFEKGHIDRRFHADDNRHVYISPNSAQQRQRAKSARRTRGQFAAKHANAGWKPLDSRARTKLRPQSACDARPPRSDLRARSTPTSTSSSRSKTANHAKPKLVVSTGGSARSASSANSSPTSGSRKTVRTPPSRQARKGKVSANSYLCQFSGQSSNGTVVIRNIKVAKRRPPSTYKKWKHRADRTKTKGKFRTITSTGKYTTLQERERQEYQISKAKWRSKEGFNSYIGKATLNISNPSVTASEPYGSTIRHFRDKQDSEKFVGKGWRL